MNDKNIKSIKKNLFFLISGSIILITIMFLLYDINKIQEIYEDKKANAMINIENLARGYISSINFTYNVIECELKGEIERTIKNVADEYKRRGNFDFQLKPFVSNNMDVYIVDKNNTIVNGTDLRSVGINFNKFNRMKGFLNDVRNSGEIKEDAISFSYVDGSVMKFFYKSVNKNGYVIELGIKIYKYMDKVLDLNPDGFAKEFIKNNKIVSNIDFFDNYGTDYKSNNTDCYDDEKYYINKTINTGKTVEVKCEDDVVDRFIPYKIGNNKLGVIKITYDYNYFDTLTIQRIKTIVIISIICLIIFIYIIHKKTDKIIEPINKIIEGMHSVSKGNYNIRLSINTNDEFEILSNNFNSMVKEIYSSKNEIINKKNEIMTLYDEQRNISKKLEQSLRENRRTYFKTIQALAKAIDTKDHYTKGHCNRVMEYSLDIAKAMGISGKKLHYIIYGSLLHDIGKIGIPEEILNKKSKLTDDEYNIIKDHPNKGYEIIKDIDFLNEGSEIVKQHHERIDGKGYPSGLSGDEIDILAKIVCIADSYDAMTSNRSYRKSLTVEQAICELERGKGTQFDPKIVDVFVDIIKKVSKVC